MRTLLAYHPAIEPIPIIYVGNRVEPTLSFLSRLFALAIAVACAAVLVTAARLTPNPSGMETHRQLGIGECAFYAHTGYPCMTCGMTTSYTYLAHGHLLSSLWAQPAGTVFAFVTAMAFWAGLYVAATGRPGARLIARMPVTQIFFTLLAIGVVGWAYKIFIVLRAHAA